MGKLKKIENDSLLGLLIQLSEAKDKKKQVRIRDELDDELDNPEAIPPILADSIMKDYFKFNKIDPTEKNQIKIQLTKILNDITRCQTPDVAKKLLENIHSLPGSQTSKAQSYSQYLNAVETYQKSTGQHPQLASAQTVSTPGKNVTTGQSFGLASASLNRSGTKQPIFINEKKFYDGGVTTFEGMEPQALFKIQVEIVGNLKKKGFDINMTTGSNHSTIMGSVKATEQYNLELDKALKKHYVVFNHSSDKTATTLPDKYKPEAPKEPESIFGKDLGKK